MAMAAEILAKSVLEFKHQKIATKLAGSSQDKLKLDDVNTLPYQARPIAETQRGQHLDLT
jgi:hypothetical protein